MSGHDQPWLHDLVTVLSAPTVVLSETGGQIRPGGAQGVMHADRRVLSTALLEVAGTEPTPVSGGARGAAAALFLSVPRGLGDDIADPTVWLEREREVAPGWVSERIRLVSAADSGAGTELVLRVAADLAGIGEIRAGGARGAAAIGIRADATGARLTWGGGGVTATLLAPGAIALPGEGSEVRLRWPVRLAGRGQHEIAWELTVSDNVAVVIPAGTPGPAARHGPNGTRGPGGTAGPQENPWAGVRAEADDARLPQLLAQSLADAASLRMATTRAPDDVFLAAGAPWYFTLFGRDSIWAARLLLPFGWQLAAGTLRALAAFQGDRVDPATAEAPGKIPHELRTAASPVLGLPPLYYGTVDATALWVCLLHDAWRWGMPPAGIRALLPNLAAALAWMHDHGDADGDGLLEYIDQSGRGLANQGWKDSADAIRFADGRLATAPVALSEVQGYAFEAAMRGADLLDAFGEPGADGWREWAGRLARAFRAAFWVSDESGPYPALALDAAKQPVNAVTSNIGHLLGTGLLSPGEEALVAERLADPAMNSGFGVRTMSSASGGYSPLSYHCGSVWSHDTAIVIRGLSCSGHRDTAAVLADGLLAAAAAFAWRLPEVFSGAQRSDVPWPAPYPASCRPQAWAAAAAGVLVQALLGLEVDVPAGTVRVEPPPRAGGAGARLHVDGLVAGGETFSAGVGADGRGYVRGLSFAAGPSAGQNRVAGPRQRVPGSDG
jgi:N-terminal domain of (some) glycogen debranching enzymes/Mannosylglycerate hydrolase MGH1-like glycoside hydrolase domain